MQSVTRDPTEPLTAKNVPEARSSTRRAVLWRRAAALGLLATPLAIVMTLELARRAGRIFSFGGYYRNVYLASVLESVIVWGTLLYAASRRRGAYAQGLAVLFVVGMTVTVGGQRYFHDQYNAYLNVDVSVFASNLMDSVINQLFADIGNYLRAKAPPFVASVLLVIAARRWIRPRRRRAIVASVFAPVLLVGSFFVPTQHRHVQAATPDVLYLEAIGGLIRTQLGYTDQSHQVRPRARSSLPVALATPAPARKPNLVVLILESVRADAVCTAPEAGCKNTPFSDVLVPDRFPFLNLRSMDSCTAISLAVLWSGVAPNESREVLHTWPLLFDYAKARGYDTAFWTSQNMMFGNARLWVKDLGVSQFVSATDLNPEADLDMGAPEALLADHVNGHIGELKEPFLAVVQFSNMHYPYLVDRKGPMPFEPWTRGKGPSENTAFFNYYLNGVYQQDRHVASMIRRIRESDIGKNTVIVYTSDHGEAFREHNQMGHTFSVLDEEVHVPGWIAAPPGFFTEQETERLRAARSRPLFHVDLTATVLDFLGVWNDPGNAKYQAKMPGQSLLSSTFDEDRALPLTNCAGVWSCAFENWGYMRGNKKLEARAWDPEWHCFDVEADPRERKNLGAEACGNLKQLAIGAFGGLPGGKKK